MSFWLLPLTFSLARYIHEKYCCLKSKKGGDLVVKNLDKRKHELHLFAVFDFNFFSKQISLNK